LKGGVGEELKKINKNVLSTWTKEQIYRRPKAEKKI
jgi:hypothetical protein